MRSVSGRGRAWRRGCQGVVPEGLAPGGGLGRGGRDFGMRDFLSERFGVGGRAKPLGTPEIKFFKYLNFKALVQCPIILRRVQEECDDDLGVL